MSYIISDNLKSQANKRMELNWEAITKDTASAIQHKRARAALTNIDAAIGGLSIDDYIQNSIADFISSGEVILTQGKESQHAAVVRMISQEAIRKSDNSRRTEDRRVAYRAKMIAANTVPEAELSDRRNAKVILELVGNDPLERAIIISVLAELSEFDNTIELADICNCSSKEVENAKKRIRRKLKEEFGYVDFEFAKKGSAI